MIIPQHVPRTDIFCLQYPLRLFVCVLPSMISIASVGSYLQVYSRFVPDVLAAVRNNGHWCLRDTYLGCEGSEQCGTYK